MKLKVIKTGRVNGVGIVRPGTIIDKPAGYKVPPWMVRVDEADAPDESKGAGQDSEIETLRKECTELGIEWKGNWGVPKLTEAIKAALGDEMGGE